MQNSDTVALTLDLIARQSVTPTDGGCQQLMIQRLEAVGFRTEKLDFGSVENFWAAHGTEGPVLCFAGHTDVVPTGPLEEWRTEPFKPTVVDGRLFGRGAADMKSGLAAMLTATEQFVRERPDHKGTIAFLITSDEEGPSVDGTKRVVEVLRSRQQRIDWCIVGEPSSEKVAGDTIKIGRRGSFSGRLTVHGVQGHVAYPQLAKNPVHMLAPALAELTQHVWDQGNQHFEPTTFQISNLNAGTGAPNVIPGELKARFNLRYSPVQTQEGLRKTVEGILDRHGVKYTIEWYVSGEPFYTPPGALSEGVCAAVKNVTGSAPKLSTGGGTSDGRFIATLGAQVVELGVTNASIHKVNESVGLDEIDALHRMYLESLRRLLG
ncbi:MAG: succinyl-diaminopimelate desuccinylase [Proteobacteria bacterium]|nr:succinyl-diaminopimelate desuccinylase [Pseudomonadota bacterium]MCC6632462.1 succinyl-diaminopimelate desuccinylase [Gammaproteobacteria bacterium]